MALKLFTDTQKSDLAKEAGVIGAPSSDSFSRDYNPNTGEATMYYKMGENQKFYGKNPNTVKTTDPVISSALRMKDESQAQQLYDAYNIANSTVPTSRAMIQNDVNVKFNYQDQFESITQQRSNIYKTMVGDQSKIFSAVNPDGTPVDPRVMVAQYQSNMKSMGDRLSQLDNLEQTYRSEAKILGDAEYDRQVKENEKAKTALLYIKEIADQAKQDQEISFKNKEFDFKKSEFDQKMALEKQKESRIRSNAGKSTSGSKAELALEKEFANDSSKQVADLNDPTKMVDFNTAHAIMYAKYAGALKKQGYDDAQVKKIIHKTLGGK